MNHPNKKYVVSIYQEGVIGSWIVNAPNEKLAYFTTILGTNLDIDQLAAAFTDRFERAFDLKNMDVVFGEEEEYTVIEVEEVKENSETTLTVSTTDSHIGFELTLEVF
jgi:hypothetical protein